jgi:hypothetical protein
MSDFDPVEYALSEDAEAPADALAAAQEEADLKWLVADPRGRRIVRRQLERSGIWRSSFTGDALNTAYREGERNGGLRLLAQITRHAPERLVEILTAKGDR